MNYKLFSVICSVLVVSLLSYSSDTARSAASSQLQVISSGKESHLNRRSMSAMDITEAVLEQNFGSLRDAQEQNAALGLENMKLSTTLQQESDDSAEVKATSDKEKQLVKIINQCAAEILKIKQDHEIEKSKMIDYHLHRVVNKVEAAARNQAQMLRAHAEEKLQMQSNYYRNIVLTAVVTATSTLALCKIPFGNMFESITKRMAGSKS